MYASASSTLITLFYAPAANNRRREALCFRRSVRPLPVKPIARDAISLYLVEEF